MKVRSVMTWLFLIAVALAGVGVGGYFLGRRSAAGPSDESPAAGDQENPAPVAAVSMAPAREADITQMLTAYGVIVSRADARQAVSAPLDVRIERLLVVPGHGVKAGDPIVAVGPSPDMRLAFQQAKDAAAAMAEALKNTQQRYDLKLATTQDLEQAKTELTEANVRLDDLTHRGANREQTLNAPQAGIVGSIEVSVGQIVSAGTPLLWIDDPHRVDARLGIMPEDAAAISPGQQITLMEQRSASQTPVKANISVVSQRVNADTHLVDVLAPLPVDNHWLLGAPISAQILTARRHALLVPRSAVLPREGHQSLFTIHDGHAVEHQVTLGLQNNNDVAIASSTPPLTAGEAVVVQGNYELDDAMAVTVVAAQSHNNKAAQR